MRFCAMGKWKLYVPILLVFVTLLGFLAWGIGGNGDDALTPDKIEFTDEKNDLRLLPYYDELEDKYFLFLPSCTSASNLSVSLANGGVFWNPSVTFQLRSDSDYGDVAELTIDGQNYVIEIWQCDTIPTVMLQGKNSFLETVREDKENKVATHVTVLDDTGDILLQEFGTFSGRGNGSWVDAGIRQEKCPYNLQFPSPVSFAQFENIADFCLLAEYSDESKLRNSLAYFAGETAEVDFASPYCYVNLYANGEYLGLYGVVTKKEYEKYSDAYQAIFECAAVVQLPTFCSTLYEQYIQVMEGDVAYTETLVNELEYAIYNKKWEDCPQIMDMESVARVYALGELLCNIDLSYASQYFYIDQESRVHAMLPWDYDWSMGSAITHFNPEQERSVMAYRNLFGNSWYPGLIQWEEFRKCVADTVEHVFDDEFLNTLSAKLWADIETIEKSRECDARRWKSARPYTSSPTASNMKTLSEFCDFFSDFLYKRRDFLVEYFQNYDEYCCVTLVASDGTWYSNVCIPKGQRPVDFIEESEFLSRISPDGWSELALMTADGIPMADIGAITEDITFVVTVDDAA